MTGVDRVSVDKAQIDDLDELVGLLNYVLEGAAIAPERPVPWGGLSKLVKDINARTSRLRGQADVAPQAAATTPQVRTSTPVAPSAAAPNVVPSAEPEVETEVDTSLQSSSLARRIQMAPRPPAGRVREVPLQDPR